MVHYTVATPALSAVEVVTDLVFQLPDAGVVHRSWLVAHVLAPVWQGIGVVEEGDPFKARAKAVYITRLHLH